MAKKHQNPLIEDPPTASSSSDDEVETSGEEEEEESSSDEEPTQNPVKIPVAVATKATPEKSAAVSAATKATPEKSTSVSAAIKATPAKTTTVSAAIKATPSKSTAVSAATEAGPGNSTAVSAATKDAPGKPTVVSVAKEDSDSDSESETETDSGSDSEDTVPPKSDKPVSVSAAKPNKKDPSSSVVALALPAEKSGKKRPLTEETPSKETKRAKIVASGEEESAKKPAFQRLWTEEDEITILQGMIDYKADTGKSPYEDTNAFYEFVKNSLSIEASKSQLMDKVRGLKKKFMGKEDKNKGAEPKFAKEHDEKTYKLSKHIWGSEGLAFESNIKSNGPSRKSQNKEKVETVSVAVDTVLIDGEVGLTKSDWFEKSFLVRSIAGLGVDEHSVKEKWNLVPAEDKKKIEVKLKKIQDKEVEFMMMKIECVHEAMSMIAEASNNKDW